MQVKQKMITDVISVFPDASISLAFQIMHESKVKNLPVVRSGKLVGMLTEKELVQFSPSKATSLSIYEINYILSETKVEQIMDSDVVTCTEDMQIEDVAVLMIENDVHMIPVVENGDVIKGIITRSDIIEAFIDILGTGAKGTTYTFKVPHKPGSFSEILQSMQKHNMNITHIIVYNKDGENAKEVIVKLENLDTKALEEEFAHKGYDILRIDVNK